MASGLVDNIDGDDSKEGDKVSTRRQEFEEYASATDASRALANKCRDYRDGRQWTDSESAILRARNQPVLTDNKIQDKCDALLGLERQLRTDPKAFPRNPQDETAADAATDALRYVADSSLFANTVQEAFDNLIVEGLCAGEVIVERDGNTIDVRMNTIRFDRAYVDPHSLKLDYSDARYKGFSVWMDEDEAKHEYPGKDEVIGGCKVESGIDDAQEDKPVDLMYFARVKNRNRVQVFTTYYREKGKWMYAEWCRGGYLVGPKVSPYKDAKKKPDCPLEFRALYRDRDSNPYGLAARFLDVQDSINKTDSKIAHLLNTKQMMYEDGAFPDDPDTGISGVAKARQELHKPDGMIKKVPGLEAEIITHLDIASAYQAVRQDKLNSMSMQGPNAAIVGNTGSISGRAKQIDQAAGQLPLGPHFEALKAWKLAMYRHAWNRIKQYWKSDMWIRVTDDEHKLKFVGLNQPLTVGEQMAEQLKNSPMSDEEKAQALQQIAQDPASQQQAMDENGRPAKRNDVSMMDMDIILDESPDMVNIQQEQYEVLAALADKRPDITTAMLIQASQLRDKKKILDQLKGGAQDPHAQALAQAQQKVVELESALKEAQIEKVKSETAKNMESAAETHVDSSVKVATFTSGPGPEQGTVSVN